jgi:hypothetical protein
MRKDRGVGRTTKEVGTRMRLQEKLGDWNLRANESERLWPFYYSKKNDTLYRSYRKDWHRQGVFTFDYHTRNDKNTYEYAPSETNTLLPEDAVPVDAMDTNNGWRMSGQLLIINKEKTKTRNDTFQKYIRHQEEHISQYYTQLEFLTVPIKIYE